MTQYVLYRRLSVEQKGKTQHGFDSQKMDMDIFLGQQDSPEIIGDFKEFVSGAADYKPELEKAMQMCRETGATLLVSKVDRLSRRVVQIATYLEGDVKFKVACMPQADNFQITIYSALAEQERTFIKQRITRGLQAAKEKGIKLGASNPKYKANREAGLHAKAKARNTEKQRQALQPVAQEVTKIISYSNGNLTLDEISNKLNEQGMLTARNNPWTKATVSKLIKQFNIEKPKLNKWGSV